MIRPPKRIVLCLDGTWNNPYKSRTRDDGSRVYKPSNPLKVCRAVPSWDSEGERQQLIYYGIGVGALGQYPGVTNRMLHFADSRLGGAWGAGFEANVEDVLTFLVNNYDSGDQIFLFGFSRGAAQARGLTRFLDWLGGLPTKQDAYWVPHLFRRYIVSAGKADSSSLKAEIGEQLQEPLTEISIDFLGVWDTVMALGSRFRASRGTSVRRRSFHVGAAPALCVRCARQALAIDETRYDFRPEIWRTHHPGQSLEQRWFPGVHSNVGGGLVRDGLANISLRWMLDEAKKLGLRTRREYTKFFRPYPQGKLYPSRSVRYRLLEAVRLRAGRGRRRLDGFSESAKLRLDKATIHRLVSRPEDHPELDLYRPRNVLELLARQHDLDAYLGTIGLEPEERRQLLPELERML